MKVIQDKKYSYIIDKIDNAIFVFFTGEEGLDINVDNIEEYKKSLKELFTIDDIGYIRQCHSDKIFEYNEDIQIGDALYTIEKKVAVGVFTADCVPVLLYDKRNRVVAAIHSGWKGTFDKITTKTIMRLIKEKGSRVEDLVVYIGPHIHQCCYEISNDLKVKFLEAGIDEAAFKGSKLDLSYIIKEDLRNMGILNNNIYEADYCTKCSKDYRFHSYRRDKDLSGRNFSLVYQVE
ncbi:peptidoglycan editing factor PgeF [Alloiococcus sp. CFN-8]|uniref:peptidoglycan editing factor PgeF n=1 Tax=Alloiococcus sp. CFN-8 TaxID=3416081 RepID=UPI003CEF84A0